MNVTVFTDLRFVVCDAPTGVGKHIAQMTSGLLATPGVSVSIVATSDQVEFASRCVRSGQFAGARIVTLPMPWKLAEAIWTIARRPVMDEWFAGSDWVYCPKNDFVPLNRTRYAATIHGARELDPDAAHRATLAGLWKRMRRRSTYRRITRQTRLVFTVSEFLKCRIVEWFGVVPENVVVVGNGVEDCFFAPVGIPSELPGRNVPYVLCVGGLNDDDGGGQVIALANVLQSRGSNLRMRLAGANHDSDLRQQVDRLPNVDLLGYVPAERLAVLMQRAVALYYPPTYETFGIVGAEALAAGCPVVTCGGTAVPEVLGDAAIYVRPDDPEAAADAIQLVMRDPTLRARLISQGRQRAVGYRWSGCVARLIDALRERV